MLLRLQRAWQWAGSCFSAQGCLQVTLLPREDKGHSPLAMTLAASCGEEADEVSLGRPNRQSSWDDPSVWGGTPWFWLLGSNMCSDSRPSLAQAWRRLRTGIPPNPKILPQKTGAAQVGGFVSPQYSLVPLPYVSGWVLQMQSLRQGFGTKSLWGMCSREAQVMECGREARQGMTGVLGGYPAGTPGDHLENPA